jgi:hypothetical protein
MEIVYFILIFIVISFSYIHIVNELKTSEDLEVYELEYYDNENLQETCSVLQPVVFKRTKTISLPDLENYKQLLLVKSTNDYYTSTESVQSVGLPSNALIQLLKSDSKSHYFSENNQVFIEESGFRKKISDLDIELKPKNIFETKYDILLGSKNTCTPCRYHTNNRKFLYVANGGCIRIKMASWKFTKYLHLIKDYENYEFKSSMNIWTKNDDLDNIQFVEFDVPLESIVFIPPYWWYSIKFLEQDTVIFEYNYSSIINKISNAVDCAKYYLHNQNIVKNYANNININDYKSDPNNADNKNVQNINPTPNSISIPTPILTSLPPTPILTSLPPPLPPLPSLTSLASLTPSINIESASNVNLKSPDYVSSNDSSYMLNYNDDSFVTNF